MDDERQHLSELLHIYQRRLRTLEKQAATLGIHTPPYVQTEMEDIQTAIARFELDLRQPVSDRPALPSHIAPTLAVATYPSVQPQQPASNLPVPLTALVGREREVAAACTLLRQPSIRLLTLVGPPGVGKTRLGIQVATELRDGFADGVVFVALEPVRDPDLVVSTIAQALGVREVGGQPLVESLKGYLRDKQLLLLLDNCEQVVSAAPRVVDVLATAPRLKVLATSRAVLRVSGERSFPVLPLPLPDPGAPPSPDQLAHSASVQLFVERAQAAQPGFRLTAANAAAVAAICQRLEGLPLAIELAAARIRLLAPEAMLGRLASRLTLLTGGARDLPAHQQTLRATIDWSYELLLPAEQALFRRLAVFVGGHTLPAVEAACNMEGDLALDVLDGLQSLLDKSLLYQREDPGGEPRFMMLETIREYALERLEMSGEAERVRQQHAAYCLALAQTAAPRLIGPQQQAWLNRLEQEHDNLRMAIQWSLDQQSVEIALQLCEALWRFWQFRRHSSEGRRWMDTTLTQSHSLQVPLRAQVLCGAGWLALSQGDDTEAQTRFDESLVLARQLQDPYSIALALHGVGQSAQDQGDHARAHALYEESLLLFRELADTEEIAWSLLHLGKLAREQGDYACARTLIEGSLAHFREVEHTWGIATALRHLGYVAQAQGDAAQAAARFQEVVSLFQDLGDTANSAWALYELGEIASLQGNYKWAARLFRAGKTLLDTLGERLGEGDQAGWDRNVATVRAQLDEASFAAIWEERQTMTLEQAITYALSEDDGGAEPSWTGHGGKAT